MHNNKNKSIPKLPKFTLKHLPIKAVPMPLFPTMGSLQEVIDLAEANLPITTKNDITALLGMYHNTLLKEIKNVKR